MAHQQESFLPFSSRQSLSCCLSRVAKRSTPKPHGPLYSPSEPLRPLFTSEPHSLLPFPSEPRGSPFPLAAAPGFKSQHQSSSAAPFPTPPTISYTCQHSRILPALLGCHSKSRQVWPHGMEPIISSSHAGPVTRGSCFPVPSWVEFGPIPLAQSRATAI